MKTIVTIGIFLYVQLSLFIQKFPSTFIILMSSAGSLKFADLSSILIISIASTMLVWENALVFRDVNALNHLFKIVSKADSIYTYKITDYIQNFETKHRYKILNISNYRIYATIQYENNSSYIIIPFKPNELNDMKLHWLLHECGHIGRFNRRTGLGLDVSRIVAIGIMMPAVILVGMGPFLSVIITIVGGILCAMTLTTGRLEAEMEADCYSVSRLKDQWTLEKIKEFDFELPSDRKLDGFENAMRNSAFKSMISAISDRPFINNFYRYCSTELAKRKLYLSAPLVLFVFIVGIFFCSPLHFDLENPAQLYALLIVISTPALGSALFLYKRMKLVSSIDACCQSRSPL